MAERLELLGISRRLVLPEEIRPRKGDDILVGKEWRRFDAREQVCERHVAIDLLQRILHADAVREEPPEQGPLRLIDVVRLLAAQQEYMRQVPLADGRHELAEFHQQRPFPKSFFLIAL